MNIRVTLYDAQMNRIESFVDEPKKAAKRAARFVWIHGSDPDEDGRDAMPGTIEFEPTEEAADD